MVALLAFMPFAFGGVDAWAEQVIVVLAGAMTACLLLRAIFSRDSGLRWSWAYVPIGLFLLLCAVQLAPMPAGAVRVVSPNTAATRAELLGDLTNDGAGQGAATLSFYPLVTRRALRLAFAAAAVFLVAANVYRREAQIKRLLGIVAAIGAAVALLALMQIATGTDKIYWTVPTGTGPATGGAFLNRNNYCQFMNLSIGAALGLLLIKLEEALRGRSVALPVVLERLGDRDLRPVWYLAGAIVLGIATVFLSLSRGGMVSLIVAASLIVLVLAIKRRLGASGWIATAIAVVAFVCVLYTGFDAVCDRLASMHLRDYQGRWQLVEAAARASARFPLLGTGLGTHEFIQPMFDESTISARAGHVENEYAQVAEETGAAGLLLIVCLLVIVWRNFGRCLRGPISPVRIAAIGLGFGLLAVMVHSFADFGQHLPANLCLSAVFAGLLVSMGRARLSPAAARAKVASGPTLPRAVAAVALAAALAVWAWALAGANAARRAEACWYQARRMARKIERNDWAVSNEDCARLISLTGRAVQYEPENALYRYWLNAFRWRSLSRVADSEPGKALVGLQGLKHVESIVKDLRQARRLCPTFGPTYSLAGQLEWFVLGRARGAELIRKGFVLAPCDAAACLAAGLLDGDQGRLAQSLDKLKRAMSLDEGLFEKIVDFYVHRIGRADLAVEIAAGDVGRLLNVASVIEAGGSDEAIAAGARAQAIALLQQRCRQPDAKPTELAHLAKICLRRGQYPEAVGYFRRALAKDCRIASWRLNLARALGKIGRPAEAIDQAQLCLRLRPGMIEAQRLIGELRASAAAVPGD